MEPIIGEPARIANSAWDQLSAGASGRPSPFARFARGPCRYLAALAKRVTLAPDHVPRANALVDLLHHELARIGRPGVAVTLDSDERTLTLEDPDARWHGSLIVCEDERARDAPLWTWIALPSA